MSTEKTEKSGSISLGTGDSTVRHNPDYDGDSGSIHLAAGDANGIGKGGEINLRVGTSTLKVGGDTSVEAGRATR